MAASENIGKNKKSSSLNIFGFLRDLKAETKRITWPSKEEIKKSTTIVLVFCVVSAIIIGIMDFMLSTLFRVIFQ
ncbi:preprotein translocase subunit SecE [Clostridium sp. DL1XJH146]